MIKMRSILSLGLAVAFTAIGMADDLTPLAPSPLPPPTAQPATPPYTITSVDSTMLANDSGKLFGIIAPSDHGFSNFISPMTNPIYFEDPRTLTEARMIFANHGLPNSLGGHNAQVLAVQARAALTDNISIIATKDGFLWSENPLLSNGFLDVNAGLKANLYKNYDSQTLLSTGFTFGVPIGSHQTLQGKGNGEFNLFVSGAQQIGDDWHLMSTFGARIPANTSSYSTSTYFSNHLDRKLGDTGFYVFTEANWYHWLTSGNQFAAPVEGLDLFNLGSVNVTGNDIVTGAYGVKYKPSKNMEIGVAYELPYTQRRDIIQDRVTVDLILRY